MRLLAFVLGALLLAWGTMGFVSASQGLHEANIALEALIRAQQGTPPGGGFWGTLYRAFRDTQQKKQVQEQIVQLKVTIEKLSAARGKSAGIGVLGLVLLAGALFYPRRETRPMPRHFEDRPQLQGPSDRPRLPRH